MWSTIKRKISYFTTRLIDHLLNGRLSDKIPWQNLKVSSFSSLFGDFLGPSFDRYFV